MKTETALNSLYHQIENKEDKEQDYQLLLSVDSCSSYKINQIFDAPMRDVLVVVNMAKDQVRVATNIYARQGNTYLGRINIAAGTVTAAAQTASLHTWLDHGVWHHAYISPSVSGSTASMGVYTVYEGVVVSGGIDRVLSSANLPDGASLKIYGIPL